MAFGLSFGANHQKSSSTDKVNKTETTSQQQTGTQTGSTSTSTSGSQNTSSSSTTQQAQSTQNQQATSTSQQSQSTQFSAPVLSALENTVQSFLGNIPQTPSSRSDTFDPNAFVSQGVQSAQASIQTSLDAALNSIFDTVGGRDDQNSMATLLANRARGDAAAQVAGIYSNLTGQAQGIESQRFQDNLSGVGQAESFTAAVMNALKGGTATSSTVGSENTSGGTTSTGVSNTAGQENVTMSQEQLTNTIQQIIQQLTGTTNTTGTETQKGSGTTVGGGLSLGL